MRRNFGNRERGGMAVSLTVLIAMVLLLAITVTTASVASWRAMTTANQIATTQRTDAAVSDALAKLNDGQQLPVNRGGATVECEDIDNRPVCYAYWAHPVPANTLDPLRYELITHTWIDNDRNAALPGTEENPSMRGVRAISTGIEAVAYSTPEGAQGKDGKIVYQPAPSGLLQNAMFSFNRTMINGPDVRIGSYNSTTGGQGTGNGAVATSGYVGYGRSVESDATVLYNTPDGAASVTTDRCTGENCDTSDVTTQGHSYDNDPAYTTEWLHDTEWCTATHDGDWKTSEQGDTISDRVLCINGSLIIDEDTDIHYPDTAVVVHGQVDISADLNQRDGLVAGEDYVERPSRLHLYTTGHAVSFDPKRALRPGTTVAARIWAPQATCSTDPANTSSATGSIDDGDIDDFTGRMNFYGSLVCDNISLGGSWHHQFDDAAGLEYTDPEAVESERVWSVGPYRPVDTGDFWDIPGGWQENRCLIPAPSAASSYWKLDEPSGLHAGDSAGNNALAWRSGSEGREDSFCGKAAAFTESGQVFTDSQSASPTNGLTLEWWSAGGVGDVVASAGANAELTSNNKVRLTAGGQSAEFPFTVQNRSSAHHYVITISNDGAARLFVDGQHKVDAEVGSPSAGGPTVIGHGDGGAVHDVVTYSRVLSSNDISQRWTDWNQHATWPITHPGDPFTAPLNVRDDGSDHEELAIAWDAPNGTFPTSDGAHYRVQMANPGSSSFNDIDGTIDGTTFTQDDPVPGAMDYRVCAEYNGDVRCSDPIEIITLEPPVTSAPTFSGPTQTSVTAGWDRPEFADSFDLRYRTNSVNWTTVSGMTGTSRNLTGLTAGAQVQAQVRGTNAAGTGPWSSSASINLIPATPSAPTLSNLTQTGARAAWTRPARATSVDIQYRTNGGSWTTVSGLTGSNRNLSGLTSGARVEARVRAVNSSGSSPYSPIRTAWLNLPSPGISTSISGANYNSSWNAVTNATGYQVQRQVNSGGWVNVHNTTTSRSGSHTPNRGDQVRMRVRAVGNGATSSWSTGNWRYTTVPQPSGLSSSGRRVSNYPNHTVRYERSGSSSNICPAGNVTRSRLQHGSSSNSWSGWGNGSRTLTRQHTFSHSSYSTSRQFRAQVRCTNTTTGRQSSSANTSTTNWITLWHPMPRPTGVYGSIGPSSNPAHDYANGRAGWTATCAGNSNPRYWYRIHTRNQGIMPGNWNSRYNTNTSNNTTWTTYMPGAWSAPYGSWRLQVHAVCVAGNRTGTRVEFENTYAW